MSLLKAVFVWCIWLGLFELSLAKGKSHYKFDVEYIYKKPDCKEHVVMGINGQFPGPTIRAEVGDTLVIDLTTSSIQRELLFTGMESDSLELLGLMELLQYLNVL